MVQQLSVIVIDNVVMDSSIPQLVLNPLGDGIYTLSTVIMVLTWPRFIGVVYLSMALLAMSGAAFHPDNTRR